MSRDQTRDLDVHDHAAPRAAALQRVRAVVIDTNAMPGGHFRTDVLAELALLAEDDGELVIWIPEPVMWEWMEHASRELERVRANYRRARKLVGDAGIEIPDLPTVAQVHERVEFEIRDYEPQVQVIEPSREALHQALRDQVLILSPGERVLVRGEPGSKSEKHVKTGASDSAWIRTAHEAAGRDAGTYIVISADSDVRKAFEEWAETAPMTLGDISQLSGALSGLPAQSVSAAESVEILRDLDLDDLSIRIANLPQIRAELVKLGYLLDRSAQIEAVSPAFAIGIQNAERHGRTGTVSGNLLYSSRLLVTSRDDAEDEDIASTFMTPTFLITQKIHVRTQTDGSRTVIPIGWATAKSPHVHHNSASDAMASVYDALMNVPGFINLELSDSEEIVSVEDRETTYEEFTTKLDVATIFEGDALQGPWVLEIAIIAKQGGATFERVVVECVMDPASANSWRLNGVEPGLTDVQSWEVAAWVTAALSCISGGIGDEL